MATTRADGWAAFQAITENIYYRPPRLIHPDDVQVCECRAGGGGGDAAICDSDACENRAVKAECLRGFCSKSRCHNMRLQRKQWAGLEVFDAGAAGRGLRTTGAVKAGDLVLEYCGEVINEAEKKRRMKEYDRNVRHYYMLGLGRGEYLDAARKGGVGRYMNHSCDPNAKAEMWTVGDETRIGVYALRDIPAGGEITIDYGWDRASMRSMVVCYCGSPLCSGYLGVSQDDNCTLAAMPFGRWRKANEVDKASGAALIGRWVSVLWEEDAGLSEVCGGTVTESTSTTSSDGGEDDDDDDSDGGKGKGATPSRALDLASSPGSRRSGGGGAKRGSGARSALVYSEEAGGEGSSGVVAPAEEAAASPGPTSTPAARQPSQQAGSATRTSSTPGRAPEALRAELAYTRRRARNLYKRQRIMRVEPGVGTWYTGRVLGYDASTGKHKVAYIADDTIDEKEDLASDKAAWYVMEPVKSRAAAKALLAELSLSPVAKGVRPPPIAGTRSRPVYEAYTLADAMARVVFYDDACDAQSESSPGTPDACMPQWLWDQIEARMAKRRGGRPAPASGSNASSGGKAASSPSTTGPASSPPRAVEAGSLDSTGGGGAWPGSPDGAAESNPLVSFAVPRRAAAPSGARPVPVALPLAAAAASPGVGLASIAGLVVLSSSESTGSTTNASSGALAAALAATSATAQEAARKQEAEARRKAEEALRAAARSEYEAALAARHKQAAGGGVKRVREGGDGTGDGASGGDAASGSAGSALGPLGPFKLLLSAAGASPALAAALSAPPRHPAAAKARSEVVPALDTGAHAGYTYPFISRDAPASTPPSATAQQQGIAAALAAALPETPAAARAAAALPALLLTGRALAAGELDVAAASPAALAAAALALSTAGLPAASSPEALAAALSELVSTAKAALPGASSGAFLAEALQAARGLARAAGPLALGSGARGLPGAPRAKGGWTNTKAPLALPGGLDAAPAHVLLDWAKLMLSSAGAAAQLVAVYPPAAGPAPAAGEEAAAWGALVAGVLAPGAPEAAAAAAAVTAAVPDAVVRTLSFPSFVRDAALHMAAAAVGASPSLASRFGAVPLMLAALFVAATMVHARCEPATLAAALSQGASALPSELSSAPPPLKTLLYTAGAGMRRADFQVTLHNGTASSSGSSSSGAPAKVEGGGAAAVPAAASSSSSAPSAPEALEPTTRFAWAKAFARLGLAEGVGKKVLDGAVDALSAALASTEQGAAAAGGAAPAPKAPAAAAVEPSATSLLAEATPTALAAYHACGPLPIPRVVATAASASAATRAVGPWYERLVHAPSSSAPGTAFLARAYPAPQAAFLAALLARLHAAKDDELESALHKAKKAAKTAPAPAASGGPPAPPAPLPLPPDCWFSEAAAAATLLGPGAPRIGSEALARHPHILLPSRLLDAPPTTDAPAPSSRTAMVDDDEAASSEAPAAAATVLPQTQHSLLLAYEYCPATAVDAHWGGAEGGLARLPPSCPRLPKEKVVYQLARALQRTADRGVVHGGVSASTVLVSWGGAATLAGWERAALAGGASPPAFTPPAPPPSWLGLAGVPLSWDAFACAAPDAVFASFGHAAAPSAPASPGWDAWSLGALAALLFTGRPLLTPRVPEGSEGWAVFAGALRAALPAGSAPAVVEAAPFVVGYWLAFMDAFGSLAAWDGGALASAPGVAWAAALHAAARAKSPDYGRLVGPVTEEDTSGVVVVGLGGFGAAAEAGTPDVPPWGSKAYAALVAAGLPAPRAAGLLSLLLAPASSRASLKDAVSSPLFKEMAGK